MEEFITVRHMAKFSCPLWLVYDSPTEVTCAKLIGSPYINYNYHNVDYVFTMLSVRIDLNLNLANPVMILLSQTAVNIHMQIVGFD